MTSITAERPSSTVCPVDEVPPPVKMSALALQHVLVMYTGAIAVPFIIGSALNLTQEQVDPQEAEPVQIAAEAPAEAGASEVKKKAPGQKRQRCSQSTRCEK